MDSRVAQRQKPEVHCADDEKPAKMPRVPPQKSTMRTEGFTEAFVMQHERDLHRAETNNERAHDPAPNRQIIENVRNIPKIGDEQRQAQDEAAHQHDDAGPFQDKAEAPQGEPEKRFLLEMQTFNPGKTNRDQINLDVNTAEVLE